MTAPETAISFEEAQSEIKNLAMDIPYEKPERGEGGCFDTADRTLKTLSSKIEEMGGIPIMLMFFGTDDGKRVMDLQMNNKYDRDDEGKGTVSKIVNWDFHTAAAYILNGQLYVVDTSLNSNYFNFPIEKYLDKVFHEDYSYADDSLVMISFSKNSNLEIAEILGDQYGRSQLDNFIQISESENEGKVAVVRFDKDDVEFEELEEAFEDLEG